eukprot:3673328-Prymnesium_polylepis.2
MVATMHDGHAPRAGCRVTAGEVGEEVRSRSRSEGRPLCPACPRARLRLPRGAYSRRRRSDVFL